MPLTEETVSLGGLGAYDFRPEPASRAGILFLPTAGGPNELAKQHARMLAEAGFRTLIWDPYPGHEPPENEQQWAPLLEDVTDEKALAAQSRWLSHLLATGVERAGVVSFCLGGRWSLLLAATDPRVAAMAVFYPSIRIPDISQRHMDSVAACANIQCPVNLIRPGQDRVASPETYQRVQQLLQSRQAPTVVQLFPEAGHGFIQRWDEPAASVAWNQALAFLRGYLAA